MTNIFKGKMLVVIRLVIIVMLLCMFITSFSVGKFAIHKGVNLDTGWRVEKDITSLPISGPASVSMQNNLPKLFDNDCLIIKAKNSAIHVSVNGNTLYSPKSILFLGKKLGFRETLIIIPLEEEYSWGKIDIDVTMEKSLYGSGINEILIDNLPNYIYSIIKTNAVLLIFIFMFLSFGVIETIVAIIIVQRKIIFRNDLFFKSLCCYGLFSVVSAVWVLCNTTIFEAITRSTILFQILDYFCLMLMMPLFLTLLALLHQNNNKLLNISKEVLWTIVTVDFLLLMLGIDNWKYVLYLAHSLSLLGLIVCAIVVFNDIRQYADSKKRKIFFLGFVLGIVFVAATVIAYVLVSSSNLFIDLFAVALFFIVVTHIALLINRIKFTSMEEAELDSVTKKVNYDDLTGIGNRHAYEMLLEDAHRKASFENLVVIYCDVNMLKYYNDTMGHEAGDALLQGAASCLMKNANPENIFRMGGDEFVVLVDMAGEELEVMIQKLKDDVSKWSNPAFVTMKLSMSIGVASKENNPDCSLEHLVAKADEEMYEDKKRFYEQGQYDRRGK